MSIRLLLLALSSKIKEWFELDYMEYSSNAAAQAAYSGDGTYCSNFITGGTASADSYVGALTPDLAADGNTATRWTSAITTLPHYWIYDLGSGITKIANKLRIYKYVDGNGAIIKDFTLQGSIDGSNYDVIYAGQCTSSGNEWQDFTFSNPNAYRYYKINVTTNYRADGYVGFYEIQMMQLALQSYSEATIKTQGSYSLKAVAAKTDSLNKTLTKTISPTINLTGINQARFMIRSSRTGSNIKIGLHDSGGTTTEITPNITSADTWQEVKINLQNVSNANKDAIDQIIITIVNADAENIFYIDDMKYG